MKKCTLILISLAYINISLSSQTNISDLEQELKIAEGKYKYELLYQISKAYLPISAKKSKNYSEQALKMSKKLNNRNMEANALNLIGTAYYQLESYKSAIKIYEQEYVVRKALKQNTESSKTLYNIASIYEAWGKESKALSSFKDALAAAKVSKNQLLIIECFESIIKIYSKDRKYKKAFDYTTKYISYMRVSDIAFERKKIAILETQFADERRINEETMHQLAEVDSSLSIVKGEKDVLIKDTVEMNLAINDLTIETKEQELTIKEQQEENKRQRQWLIAFISFFIVILIFSILLYFQVRAKKKANKLLTQKNAEILEQKEEITVQSEQLRKSNVQLEESREEIQTQAEELKFVNNELRYQNEQITDSIHYARKIQSAMLPHQEFIDELIPDNMVLCKPRDIVSGDFYWYKQIKNSVIFAAADCTGHGVPGAFMSMLGISFLNDIVSKERFGRPNEILNSLRSRIKRELHQTGKEQELADGMDISLCILDTEYNILQFAGAYNSLYLIRDNKLQVFKADRQPVAVYVREKDFTNHEIQVQKGDCIYLFSDGYKDQFGGEQGRKFKTKRFNELLLEIHQKPMPEQQKILNKTIMDWMGGKYAQVDDILVLGMKV